MDITFKVPDMTCGHCVQTITEAITAHFPAAQVQADVSTHTVRISGVTERATIEQLIKDEGYSPSLA